MSTTLTRFSLSSLLHKKVGLSQSESDNFVITLLNEISQGLLHDGYVRLSSFGVFTVKEKTPRIGRNPKTGELKTISARRVVTFHASDAFKSRLTMEKLPLEKLPVEKLPLPKD